MIRRAIELDPGYVYARQQYGLLLADLGRLEESEAQLVKAHDLDPISFDPGAFDLGRILEWQGRDEEALALWKEKQRLAPGYAQPYLHLGDYLCRHGRPEEGVRQLEEARSRNPHEPWIEAVIAHCHAISGRSDEARAILRDLEERSVEAFIDPGMLALILVPLGEEDRALDELERAAELHSVRLPRLFRDPHFAPLRDDPRFGALMRRVGLPPEAGSDPNSDPGDRTAFFWTSGKGMRSLESILLALGLGADIAGWHLEQARAISDDGTTIAGFGQKAGGEGTIAFLAVIPEPSTALLLAGGLVALIGLRRARGHG